MDLFRARKIASKYQLQNIKPQQFQPSYDMYGMETLTDLEYKVQPEQYYKLLISIKQQFCLPNNLIKDNIPDFKQRLPKLEHPLTAIGLLLVQGQGSSVIQIGALFRNNYIVSTYSNAFELGDNLSLTFYPTFNENQYVEGYKVKNKKTNQNNEIAFFQLQSSKNVDSIFGKIPIQNDFILNEQNMQRERQERPNLQNIFGQQVPRQYRQARRGGRGRRRDDRGQIPNNRNQIYILFYSLQRNLLELNQIIVPQTQFNSWIKNYGEYGICLKFQDGQYKIIGIVSQFQFISILQKNLQEFSNVANVGKFKLDCSQMNLSYQQSIWTFQKKWQNLTQINLEQNRINQSLCSYLSHAFWPQIKQIFLSINPLGTQGILWLTRASFPYLQTLQLKNTLIDDQGCEKLSKSNWSELKKLNIAVNMIRAQGCKWLSQAKWPNLKQLNMKKNKFRGEGCKYLADSSWNLQKVQLSSCLINDIGCKWLIRSKWSSLTYIDLQNNFISNLGYKWLSKANWFNLTTLLLSGNLDTKRQGFEHISRMSCNNLYKLSIDINDENLLSNYQLLKATFPYLCIIETRNREARQPRFRRGEQTQPYSQRLQRRFKDSFKYFYSMEVPNQ